MIKEALDALFFPASTAEPVSWRWATVVSPSPLLIRLDGETNPLAYTPATLRASGSLVAGDRVYVQLVGKRAVVIGTVDGSARMRLSATDEATLTSTAHALQIGPTTAANLVFDPNEVQARDNGVAAQFRVNEGGGDVLLGTSGAVVSVPGVLSNPPKALAAATNLNTLVTSGTYACYTSANATAALNFPEVTAGLLEVAAAASGTQFVWQRYTSYHPDRPNVYERTNYAGTWGAWHVVMNAARWDTVDVQQMITTTGITATTTDAQVGQAISMDCLAGDKIKVEAVFDITAGAVTFIGKLFSNGASAQTGEAHIAGTATTTIRATVAVNYLIDITTAGTRSLTLRASTTTGTAVVSATHTRFTATLLRQS